ncbi:MAG: tRNA pseudouridine(55) synthase TruB, partial [Acidobacteriota bacterium]
AVDGILIIDKSEGMTSHDVVARVRRILSTKRIGHTGTLDPFATGVMVLLVGGATRFARFLDKDVKEYVAEVQFGFETDTGDGTGMRNAECGMRNEEIEERISTTDWDRVFTKFRGDILQTPPMYSAKKVEGKKLYELARKGLEVPRKPVPVSIRNLELLPNEISTPKSAIRIRVVCSAGTYIRTLAEEIGRDIGVGAHLTDLRRTAAGKFALNQSVTIAALSELASPAEALLPADIAVSHLPEFGVRDDRVGPTRNGLATGVDGEKYDAGQFVRMTGDGGNVIAVGIYDDEEKTVRPKVVLI